MKPADLVRLAAALGRDAIACGVILLGARLTAAGADCGFDPADWVRGAVHFVLCDGRGKGVSVDCQSPHHLEYQRIRAAPAAECAKLVVRRMPADLPKAERAVPVDSGPEAPLRP